MLVDKEEIHFLTSTFLVAMDTQCSTWIEELLELESELGHALMLYESSKNLNKKIG